MTTRLERITQQRLDKVEQLKALGINPYPHRYHRTHTSQEAVALLEKQEKEQVPAATISVAGRVSAIRRMGKATFVDIRDGSGKLQLLFRDMVEPNVPAAKLQAFRELDLGDFIGASGKIVRTRTGEPTIQVEDFTLLAKALRPLPEKWHGLADVETRYRQRYLDLIANADVKRIFQVRSQAVTAIRCFLNERGFIEVETPILQPEAGGALARPFITHHHALDRDLYLRIATELHLKRLIIGGFDKVYELGRVFRNEGIDTKHNPEFTTLETYEAYADYSDVMKMVEEMVSSVCMQVLGTTAAKYGDTVIDFKTPWRRWDLREAVRECSGIDFTEFPDAESLLAEMRRRGINADPSKDRGRLIDDLISAGVEPKLVQPTFLVDYPVEMSPLAKRKPGDDRFVERFEAFAGCMEIANAFTELNDPLDQRKRFEKQLEVRRVKGDGKCAPPPDEEVETIDEDFLLAMEYGMPPTGGLGVGIDRLVMILSGQQSIREVILFPHLREKI